MAEARPPASGPAPVPSNVVPIRPVAAPRPAAEAPAPAPLQKPAAAPRAWQRPNRLALRLAGVTAAILAVSALVLVWLPLPTWAVALALVGVGSAAAYGAAHHVVARRLELARQALREARKRRFEALDGLPATSEHDELDQLVYQVYRTGRALQSEIERMERLEDYRREFLGDVSHELKTPIFTIAGFAESLLDGALEDERVNRRFVEKILRNAGRLDALSKDLTEISRIETGELSMRLAYFHLGPLVQEVAESLEVAAAERRVRLDVHVPAGLPPVLGDRDRVRQVVQNLAENALKYNNPGGRVELTARLLARDGAVRFAVVDDGLGIPKEAIPRLTDRFFRVDKSRSREQGGTGLGLAIVKHILEAHGQQLAVESEVGYGSSFSFRLAAGPGASKPEHLPVPAVSPRPNPSSAESAQGGA